VRRIGELIGKLGKRILPSDLSELRGKCQGDKLDNSRDSTSSHREAKRPSKRITVFTMRLCFARKAIVWTELIVQRVHISMGSAGFCLLLAASLVHGQISLQLPPLASDGPLPKILDRYPEKPTLPPIFTIAVGPLGFSVPGESYLLRRESLVSLDFLDEDRILFTFRVPVLLQRDAGDRQDDQKQQIQALVLSLASGKVEARTTWTVPDHSRYLWMLNDGHFLLRAADGLDEGDAELRMKPYLRVPGRLLWISMDPRQQVLIANYLEPAFALQRPGEPGPPAAEPAAATTDGRKADEQRILVARTQKFETGEVVHESRVPWSNQTADWPVNFEGYLESSRDKGDAWLLKLNSFSGGSRELTSIDSTCPPDFSFVSEQELLVTWCNQNSGWNLGAMLTGGGSLWETRIAMNAMMPVLVMAPNSTRVARETLLLKRSAGKYKRMVGVRDLQGQMVKVIDAANGKMVLESPLKPIFDGGGNVAISPSGDRVAILNAGAIEVFQLPAPPAVPGSR
jgi:hypothetical protein